MTGGDRSNRCAACGAALEPGATHCSQCGRAVTRRPAAPGPGLTALLIIAGLIAGLIAYLAATAAGYAVAAPFFKGTAWYVPVSVTEFTGLAALAWLLLSPWGRERIVPAARILGLAFTAGFAGILVTCGAFILNAG